jgi:hypothetical protein
MGQKKMKPSTMAAIHAPLPRRQAKLPRGKTSLALREPGRWRSMCRSSGTPCLGLDVNVNHIYAYGRFPAGPSRGCRKKVYRFTLRPCHALALRSASVCAIPPRTDSWPSGRRRTPGKCVGGEPSRGFESLTVRHLPSRKRSADQSAGFSSLNGFRGWGGAPAARPVGGLSGPVMSRAFDCADVVRVCLAHADADDRETPESAWMVVALASADTGFGRSHAMAGSNLCFLRSQSGVTSLERSNSA